MWSWVEKRRWHSGPPMQRSCSVSLPSRPTHTHAQVHPHSHGRSHTLPLVLQALPPPPRLGVSEPAGAEPGVGAGAGPGSLPRSRSQPCVLSEKKVAGVKRRRPDEHSGQEARPSLDLAKMTQVNPYQSHRH